MTPFEVKVYDMGDGSTAVDVVQVGSSLSVAMFAVMPDGSVFTRRTVTGVDGSEKALDKARSIVADLSSKRRKAG